MIMEKKYLVTLDIEARYEVEVKARDEDDAETQALDAFDFLAEAPLRADAVAIADEEHSDDQFGVDRGASDAAIKWLQLLVQIRQHGRANTLRRRSRWVFGIISSRLNS